MFRVTVFLALVAFATAARLVSFNSQLDGEWLEYKKFHNKNYQAGEELKRYSIVMFD